MEIIFSVLPVLLFLISLFLFDNFKLVSKVTLTLSLLWGLIAAFASYHLNSWFNGQFVNDSVHFARYIAPAIEELLKGIILIILFRYKRIGFIVDAAIYGFAAGTGFSLAENMVYLVNLSAETSMLTWVLRGLGTALMHGGSTALFAMLVMAGIQRDKPLYLAVFPGMGAAYFLHSIFNHFWVHPLLQTIILLILFPLGFILIFNQSNKLMQDWLELEFTNEIEMLRMMRQGNFKQTKAGQYLISLKEYFAPETIADIYAYIRLHLELSVKAKRNLMLRENDFNIVTEPETANELFELQQLRKQIGIAGEMALKPIITMKYRELWKLSQLK